MSEQRVVVEFDGGDTATYFADVPVGGRVEAEYGAYPYARRRSGTVVWVYPVGPNYHLRIPKCGECGRATIALPDGRHVEPYFGPAKKAWPA